MHLDITVPWPPSANQYWRNVNGRTLVSEAARLYKKTILQLSYTWPRVRFSDERISLEIVAFPPDRRARDLDNLIKVTCDAFQGTGIFEDDSQIDKITIERGDVIKDGSLKIRLSHY